MKIKQFLVEITIPEETGDLCWDQDETGLQAFYDCVVSCLPLISLRQISDIVKQELKGNVDKQYKSFIERKCNVRDSFKVIRPVSQTSLDNGAT